MANKEYIEMLKSSVKTWNERRQKGWTNWEDLTGADFRWVNLSEADLYQVDLTGADLTGADLTNANIGGSAKLINVTLIGANLTKADLSNANLTGSNLHHANLTGTNLTQAILHRADLSGTQLALADVTNSSWYRAKLDSTTKLKGIRSTASHRSIDDGTDDLHLTLHLRYLQWSFIRNIGQLPLFGVSWIGLATSLLILNNLGWWNNNFARQILLLASGLGPISEKLTFEISIPGRLVLTVLDALLLVIGSTLYKFACPQRIQTFTEVEWVEQHRNLRLLYLSDSFSRPSLRGVTLFFLLVGGLLTLYLLIASIVSATQYAWPVIVQWFV